MSCDLSELFLRFASRLPDGGEELFSFRAGVLPPSPAELRTDRIVVEKGFHDYDGLLRRDRLIFYGSKAAYCDFALLAASILFSPSPGAVTLWLDHPASRVRRIVLRRARPREDALGYQVAPLSLNYSPETVGRHPWAYERVRPEELPAFFLTNAQECVMSDGDWNSRDVVIGFGRDEGFARVVELLLNISRGSSVTNEVALEGEGGFRGVAPLSCEATFLLPGSFGWDCTFWPEEANL